MLKVGTDCSGIEAPIQALNLLGVKYEHKFSSDIDIYARKSITANYHPEVLYEDMTKPRNLPKLDIYVCGFPCQPFSMVGSRKGSDDDRGNIFLNCISVIKQTEPVLFILENVKGILTVQGGEYFKNVTKELEKLENYTVKTMILNTKNYGIPQNRERLFIIGMLTSKLKNELKVPEHIVCKDIKSFIDVDDKRYEEYSPSIQKIYNQIKDAIFASTNGIRPTSTWRVSPLYCNTIICTGVWCVAMHRKANIKELLLLQGFPADFKQVVSDNQMKKQIGNSMTVNVLVSLFKECFKSLEWGDYFS